MKGNTINYKKSGYIHLLFGLSAVIACRIWRRGFELEPSSGTDFWLLILLVIGSGLIGSGIYRLLPIKHGSFWNSPARWYGTMGETWFSAMVLFVVFMSYSLYSDVSPVGVLLVILILGAVIGFLKLIGFTKRPHKPLKDNWIDKHLG